MDRQAAALALTSRGNWDSRLELRLAADDAAHVLNTATLFRLARHESKSISRASVERWIADACAVKRLVKVVRGLYLNRMVSPAAELYEAAIWLRPNCVVSLQTVLGESGVWNNYTNIATVVVPFVPNGPRPSLGKKVTLAGEFQFRGMPESFLIAGKECDRLADVAGYLRATPEAALMHWLYLARSAHSTLASPPLDLDLDELSVNRLQRLAKSMEMVETLKDWMRVKKKHDASQSVVEKTWIP